MSKKKAQNVLATGKRKTAMARASLSKGKGIIRINHQDIEKYITNETLRLKLKEPLILSDSQSSYNIFINVFGGGQSSQVEACRQAIARALVKITKNDDLRKKFIEYNRALIVSDTRFKETKKPNNSHARAKRQKSYR